MGQRQSPFAGAAGALQRLRRGPHGRRAGASGAALVEFAILLPVLAILLFGIIDLGRVFYTYEALANAAREGARYCSLHAGDTPGTVARIQNELNSGTQFFVTDVDYSVTSCPNVSGPVDVKVGSTFTLITPLISDIVGGGSLKLEATATMVMWQ